MVSHLVEFVDAAAAVVGAEESASLQREVVAAAVFGQGNGEASGRGAVAAHVDTTR